MIMVSTFDILGLNPKKSTNNFIKNILKIKQLKTVIAYLNSCTLPLSGL